jgi:hypothetical protein
MQRKLLSAALCCAMFILTATPNYAAKAATTDAVREAAMNAEIEKEFLVGMYSIKELCKEQFLKNAKQIEEGYAANFSTSPDALKAFAKSKPFATRVAERKKEQIALMKDAAEKKQFEATCANFVSGELTR